MPVWTHDYRRRAAVAAQGSYATALNAALGEVYAELARDLAQADLKRGASAA